MQFLDNTPTRNTTERKWNREVARVALLVASSDQKLRMLPAEGQSNPIQYMHTYMCVYIGYGAHLVIKERLDEAGPGARCRELQALKRADRVVAEDAALACAKKRPCSFRR